MKVGEQAPLTRACLLPFVEMEKENLELIKSFKVVFQEARQVKGRECAVLKVNAKMKLKEEGYTIEQVLEGTFVVEVANLHPVEVKLTSKREQTLTFHGSAKRRITKESGTIHWTFVEEK